MKELWFIECGKRRRGIERTCPICNKKFIGRERARRKHCSRACKDKGQLKEKAQLKCPICEKEFERRKSSLRAKSDIYFCSKECKNRAAKLTGIKEIWPSHYGNANYHRLLFESDEFICLRCGYDEFVCGIDIHHKDRNRNNNDKNNLTMLCSPCHRALHQGLWELNPMED